MKTELEKKYIKWLDKNKIDWEYKTATFNLGRGTYTPSFYLVKKDEFIDLKEDWTEARDKKFQLFKKKFYSMNITLLTENKLKQLGVL